MFIRMYVCECAAEQKMLCCSHLITIPPLIGSSLTKRFLRAITGILSPLWLIPTGAQNETFSPSAQHRQQKNWVFEYPLSLVVAGELKIFLYYSETIYRLKKLTHGMEMQDMLYCIFEEDRYI